MANVTACAGIACEYRNQYGICMLNTPDCTKIQAMIHQTICQKCGGPLSLFYNAGAAVWGCRRCFERQQITYSDHTEPLPEPLYRADEHTESGLLEEE